MKHTRLDIYKDYSNSQIEAAINEWIHSERDRAVLRYKLIDGLTYDEIAGTDLPGKVTRLSVDRIKQIVYSAEKTLYKHLNIK